MWVNTTMGMAMPRKQVGEFMQQRPPDLISRNLAQRWIQPNLVAGKDGNPGCCPHAAVPAHDKVLREMLVEWFDGAAPPLLKLLIPHAKTAMGNSMRRRYCALNAKRSSKLSNQLSHHPSD
jgi:hypothetical protein